MLDLDRLIYILRQSVFNSILKIYNKTKIAEYKNVIFKYNIYQRYISYVASIAVQASPLKFKLPFGKH